MITVKTSAGNLSLNEAKNYVLSRSQNKKTIFFIKGSMLGLNKELKDSKLPGVEWMVMNVMKYLQNTDFSCFLIIGNTDNIAQNGLPLDERFLVIPNLVQSNLNPNESDYYNKVGPIIEEIKTALVKLVGNNLLIAQNTTNAALHNPILGASVKEYFEHVKKGICWVYDFKSTTDSDYGRFFPSDSEKLRYIFISNTRKNQIKTALRKAGISNRVNWQKSTIIYPPVINEKIIQPKNFREFADSFSPALSNIQLRKGITPSKLFLRRETFDSVITVPSRIVRKKHIDFAIAFISKLSKVSDQKIALIITGPSDFRKMTNKDYYYEVLNEAKLINRENRNLKIFLLNGVNRAYLSWIYSVSDSLFCPFEDEGFCYPPSEASLVGCPSIIYPDPALMESTGGNAHIIRSGKKDLIDIRISDDEVASVMRFLENKKLRANISQKLARKVKEEYVESKIMGEIYNLINGVFET